LHLLIEFSLLQTKSYKIHSYSISSGTLKQYPILNGKNAFISSVIFTENYQLWGTPNGLIEYNLSEQHQKPVLPGVLVMSVFKGTQDIIWVGTDTQGVWYLSPSMEKFKTLGAKEILALGRYPVRAIFKSESSIWIGTKGGGMFSIKQNQLDAYNLQFSHYTTDHGLINNSVFVIAKGSGNEYWIGTDGAGINYYDIKKGKIFTIHTPDSIKNNINLLSVYAILPTDDETIWVGTSGNGMYKLTIDRKKTPYQIRSYKQYLYSSKSTNSLSNNIVYSIIRDDEEHLWIGTRGGGINRFNIVTEKFQSYKFNEKKYGHLSNDDILCLFKGSDGALWAGTSIGLNRLVSFKDDEAIFMHFTEKEGMPNNTIHGILEDENNNIWVSTNKGLAKIVSENQQYRIVPYYAKDGLQNNEFSDGASYYDSQSGLMYFGGISGLNYFNPLDIKYSSYFPTLFLDAFFLDNLDTNMNDYLQNDKHENALVLSYKNKSFSFKFIPLDYISSTKCEISYQLVGYNNDWINIGTSNTIVFTNLPVGKYKLKVRCSNADKIWSNDVYTLNIRITPPWWATIYAYILYFILFILSVYGAKRLIKYQMDVKHQFEIKELEEKKTEEIHEAKLRFFTNIAHEFSNSLTLIYGPCEQLLKRNLTTEYIKKYIHIIKSNSERMQKLIQQLIEFRKAETGHLKTKIENVDIVELIKFISDNFMDILEQKKIKFILNVSESIVWPTDRDCMEKIIFNLISNAVKYTPQDHEINISLLNNEEKLIIRITNTGVGIKPEFTERIFDRFEVLERFEMQVSKGSEFRNGIGLALCKNLVELLKGSINVLSDGVNFTTFETILPSLQLSEDTANQEDHDTENELFDDYDLIHDSENTNNPDWSFPDKQKLGLVLVIDDESEIRNLLFDVFNEKFEVILAANGSEAIELMKIRLPRIIICDIIMPVMTGIEFVKIMKNQELTRHIPIVLLSTRNSIENQIQGIEIGADAYLNKPFHPRHIEALISRLLQRNDAILKHSESHYAAMEQYEGKLINKEDKILIDKILRIIYDNIDNENLNIEYLANETALSKIQLYRKMKEVVEQTPTEFVRTVRLKYAEKLLITTNKTVQEIMYCCGFNNKTYFYREFAKKYQQTPKEYRSKK
jgi:signal transduction histidine kinase/DNA-binding response OmpR family regulator/streptogramin lyase